MADQRLTRPQLPIPSWANDTLIDPGETWDATPTKVEPGSGKRDDGWLPEENPSAQHSNQLDHEQSLWLQFFANMQVMNWEDVGVPQEVAVNTTDCITWDEGDLSWITGARADIVVRTRDEILWEDIGPSGAGFSWHWATSKRPGDAPAHTGPRTLLGNGTAAAVNNVVEFATVGPWATQVLPGAGNKATNTGIWDVGNSLWLIGGIDNGNPSFWYDVTPIAGCTQVVPAQVNSSDVIQIATDRSGNSVAIGDATPFDVWTSSNGTAWTRATPTGITVGEEARAIAWDEDNDNWILLTDKACYTSSNGTSWSQVSVSYLAGADFQFRCLVISGSAWVACNDRDPYIRFSGDGGITWKLLRVPVGVLGTVDPLVGVDYSRGRGRFMAVWVDTGIATGRAVRSLAVGTSIYEADQTIVLPTVT